MSSETLALVFLSFAKWVTYLGVLGLSGAVTAELIVLPRTKEYVGLTDRVLRAISDRFRYVASLSAVLLVAGAGARLYAQTYSAFGVEERVTAGLLRVVAFESRWGALWMPQVVAGILAVISVGIIRRYPRVGWPLAALAVLGLVVTLPLTGHAMAHTGEVALTMTLQSLHGLAAGIWLGTLATLVVGFVALRGSGDDEVIASLVHAFSPVALAAAAVVAVTGFSTTYLYTVEWSDLIATPWGRILLFKTAVVLLTAIVGAYHWLRLRPRLGTPGATATLTGTARLELGLAVLVLAATSVLVHVAQPHQ